MKAAPLAILLTISAIALLMMVFRTQYSQNFVFAYMGINLTLAWIPFFISLILRGLKKNQQSLMAILSILWLLFYPNTFYLVTDFIHLKPRSPIPIWFDAGMLTLFAGLGIAIGYISLYLMEQLLKKRVQHELFSVSILLLTSFGLYIGRFLRFNSWDILVRPIEVTHQSIISLGKLPTWAFLVITSIFLLAGYYGLRPILKQYTNSM